MPNVWARRTVPYPGGIPSKRGNGPDQPAWMNSYAAKKSQSPRSGAMVLTICCPKALKSFIQVSIPSKRGNGSDMDTCRQKGMPWLVSIPSKRGNGSDHETHGVNQDGGKSLNPLEAGQWF